MGLVENPLPDDRAADHAHLPGVECRVDPTLAELVAAAQRDWWRFRNAQLHILAIGAPLLHFAEAQERVFREYCGYVLGEMNSPQMVIDPARASLEALAFALQVWKDPDACSLTRAQRAEYASGLGWFAHMCPETDPDRAVELARSKGRLAGIAALYRQYKDKKDPGRKRRLAKARATRSAHATGNNGNATSPAVSVALPSDDAQASPPEMAMSVRDDTVSAPATPGGEEPAADSLRVTDKHVADEPKAGANPTEKIGLPLAVTNAAVLARTALYKPELARLLVDHLWVMQGIRPRVNRCRIKTY